MITHRFRTIDVRVAGGDMRVGIWDPIEVTEGAPVPDALLVHGITSSHLAWQHVVPQLPNTRLIAPDLRGRGASNSITGAAGLQAHATDLLAVLEALEVATAPVIGHSMGAFVSVALTHVAPERVSQLVLVDGGLPLDMPPGLDPEELVAAILGSTAKRLSRRFGSVSEYLDYWREQPAFVDSWSPEIENYFAYDMVPAGDELRPATTLATTTDDTIDMYTGTLLGEALAGLPNWGRPITFVGVPRGLRDETPGLYAPEYLSRVLDAAPHITYVPLADLNHYTVVMSAKGASQLGELLRERLG